jgi:hypothetical protein
MFAAIPPDVAASRLDLADVDTLAQLKVEFRAESRGAHAQRLDRAGPIERRQRTIAGCADQPAAKSLHLEGSHRLVVVEQLGQRRSRSRAGLWVEPRMSVNKTAIRQDTIGIDPTSRACQG